MSAFDEAGGRGGSRGGGGGARAPAAARGKPAGGGASGFDSVSSSSASASGASQYGGFQGTDSAYSAFRDGVERDLRKLTSIVAAMRGQVEKLGAKGDGADLRKRM